MTGVQFNCPGSEHQISLTDVFYNCANQLVMFDLHSIFQVPGRGQASLPSLSSIGTRPRLPGSHGPAIPQIDFSQVRVSVTMIWHFHILSRCLHD